MRLATAIVLVFSSSLRADHDLVIYGGTAAGVATAVQAARMGKTAILIEPGAHIGGLTSGGLGFTDSGNKAVVGGISREFYQRVKKHYDNPANWNFGKKDDFKNYRPDEDSLWTFEPKVAEQILRDMLKEHKIEVVFNERLDRAAGVKSAGAAIKAGDSISSITMESGKTYAGKMFVDATYEGDLMAAAKVQYTVGRDANSKYGETLSGVATKWQTHNHRFTKNVSPYVTAGDPKSGLLPGVEEKIPADGTEDHRVQAYCYRMCMSLDPNNRIPYAKPEGYDEKQYELLLRNFEAGDVRLPLKPDMMPNGKTDTNNNLAVSTDYIGMNYKYPEAGYGERAQILKAHLTYQQGLMWTLQSHPRTPKSIRDAMAKWGVPKDEFQDTGGWPHQIYVREARRMIGNYVQTEMDCRKTKATPASVGMGSYAMDSHNCTRYVTAEGFVQNEGDVQEHTNGPYRISYHAIVPKNGDCPNLLVPICVSSSHMAYGSIRMEPVFMILGQSAATAACIAIDDKSPVQGVNVEKLQAKLREDKQVLEYAGGGGNGKGVDPKKLEGIVVDDDDAKLKGFDTKSSANPPFVGSGYRHDGDDTKGFESATFTPTIPASGTYEVRVYYSPNENRAAKVPVTIDTGKEKTEVLINQKTKAKDGFVSIGKIVFEKGTAGSVTITNKDTVGHVIVDAVQWVKVKE